MDPDLPDLSGRTYLLTGSTSGIGRDAARRLGARRATVLVHGRDAEAGRAVVREEHAPLAALCNNAGLFATRTRESDDGCELTVAVNHLAPFLLTHELAGHLADGTRVVTTSSEAHRSGTSIPSVFIGPRDSPGGRPTPIRSSRTCCSPGNSPAGSPRGTPRTASTPASSPGVADTVEDGGRALAYLAASTDVADVTGAYFDGTRRRRPAPAARDDRTARRLWETSADLVGIDPELPVERTTADG